MRPLEFISRREPALAPRPQDAVGMRMPPAGVVALGEQQHVLAERGQQFAA